MELIIDLHIHSHYSRATSKNSDLVGLYEWGKRKGIIVIGTGDFTHPAWLKELQEQLEPAEGGLYQLNKKLASSIDSQLPAIIRDKPIRFIPTSEISTIYSQGGKVRKIHQVVVAPNLKTVAEINKQLEKIGNLQSDGRPILGMSAKKLFKLVLESSPDALYIPAHIWTPWFGVFGSKSGFDSLEEAYEELAPKIQVVETGLSADPETNWRIKELDGLTSVSHSDAHSPQKLGREANIVDTGLSYKSILGAIRTNDQRFVGTIEFFPEEGRYHWDGHVKCGIRFRPEQTKAHNGICPVCGRPLTIGVEYRVEELANYPVGRKVENSKKVEHIIPLPEIIAELRGLKTTSSTAVIKEYENVCQQLGDEFSILRSISIQEIKKAGFDLLALAIERMRAGNVLVESGYDGQYGKIKVFKDEGERLAAERQLSLL